MKEYENKPEQILFVCTSCNDFGFVSPEAFDKLMKEKPGNPETICLGCGGTMILPKESSSTKEDKPRFFSRN